jgi:microcystin degradation protein MlrC
MKIVIARLNHETNSFSPVPTPLVAFGAGDGIGPRYGRDASEATRGARVGMSAMIAAAQARGCEIVTPLDATANPSGPVDAAAYTHLVKTIVDAVAQGCDAVLLDLHGAMVAENSVDGEGDLLEKIRAVAPRVPVSVALDLHGNISPKMVKHASASRPIRILICLKPARMLHGCCSRCLMDASSR